VVDRVERVEVLDPARVGDRDEGIELPEVLDRERDPLLVRERPEDVGGDRAAQVRVKLREAPVRHAASLSASGRAAAGDAPSARSVTPA
jgi:hypothetical protein